MSETVTITISKSIGYSGNKSSKSYIAKIDGTHKQYIFSRDFVDTECTDKQEMFRIRRKGKGSWTEAAALEPGLYERQSGGDRSYIIVYIKDGSATHITISEDRAISMACKMDDGMTFEESRIATKPPVAGSPASAS